MKKYVPYQMLICIAVLLLTACAATPETLTVMTHDSFAVSEQIIRAFEEEHGVKINFLLSGDTGSMLNRAILTKNAPIADVLYGVDNTFLSRALLEDIFIAYDSPLLKHIPEDLQLDTSNRALPVDYGDVCINYDKKYFEENDLEIPRSLDDLLDPRYYGLLVVQNPATSSPGLAFLLTTIANYGEEGYLEYWDALKQNGVVVVNDWETAYYSNFSASSGKGAQPMVVSYATSPPAEVIFAEQAMLEAPTASIVAPDTCFRQIEFVAIIKGTQKRQLAEKFVDFMLSVPFQEDIPLQMFVFPANINAGIPQEFIDYAQVPEQPARLDFNLIAANRETWIESWREVVLQ